MFAPRRGGPHRSGRCRRRGCQSASSSTPASAPPAGRRRRRALVQVADPLPRPPQVPHQLERAALLPDPFLQVLLQSAAAPSRRRERSWWLRRVRSANSSQPVAVAIRCLPCRFARRPWRLPRQPWPPRRPALRRGLSRAMIAAISASVFAMLVRILQPLLRVAAGPRAWLLSCRNLSCSPGSRAAPCWPIRSSSRRCDGDSGSKVGHSAAAVTASRRGGRRGRASPARSSTAPLKVAIAPVCVTNVLPEPGWPSRSAHSVAAVAVEHQRRGRSAAPAPASGLDVPAASVIASSPS